MNADKEVLSDREMVQKPSLWPWWPFLALKRGSEVGILHDNYSHFSWMEGTDLYSLKKGSVANGKKIGLSDVLQLLDDGWVLN